MLDMQKTDEANKWFLNVVDLLFTKLKQMLTAAGKPIAADATIKDLMVESIFDTDEIKQTKQLVAEVHGYIDEVEFLIKNKHLIDKAKEKKEENVQVSAAFSKMPENAAEFKVVTLKKRTAAEVTPSEDKSGE